MITVGELKTKLENFSDDDLCYAYEGEGQLVVVVTNFVDSPEGRHWDQVGWICTEDGEVRKEGEYLGEY